MVTKLPMTGHSREASIASGSTTTRLLGTFQAVEFVLIVGVGGGVPHYTDYARHVRLGDVVLASPGPGPGERFIYQYCQTARWVSSLQPSTSLHCPPLQGAGPGRARRGRVRDKFWCPPEPLLQQLAAEVREAEAAPRLHRGQVAAERGVAWHWTTRGTERLAAAGVCLQKGCPLLQG